jgi:hypothetical protein
MMSKELKIISNTGKYSVDLQITAFMSKDKPMIQLTQGCGGCAAIAQLETDEVGFIQLTISDAYKVVTELTQWIKAETQRNVGKVKKWRWAFEAMGKTKITDCYYAEDEIKNPAEFVKLPWTEIEEEVEDE